MTWVSLATLRDAIAAEACLSDDAAAAKIRDVVRDAGIGGNGTVWRFATPPEAHRFVSDKWIREPDLDFNASTIAVPLRIPGRRITGEQPERLRILVRSNDQASAAPQRWPANRAIPPLQLTVRQVYQETFPNGTELVGKRLSEALKPGLAAAGVRDVSADTIDRALKDFR